MTRYRALYLSLALGWLALGLAAAPGPAAAQQPADPASSLPTQRIDSVFLDLDRTDSPGCAVGLVRGGALVFADGYGSANLDHELPITPETVFYMGSVSKQFTAAAVLMAARQGHLTLDDDVREWVPELPDYGPTITVRHLIHHTSGIRDYLTLQSIAGSYGGVTDAEVLELLARQKALNFEPGQRYLYSNSGYFLLSEIVERATGLSLREFADRHIFTPLGMRYSHFHDRPDHIVRNRATGYAPTEAPTGAPTEAPTGAPTGAPAEAPDPGFRMEHAWDYAQVGAGGLYSNIVDMARWETAFEAGAVGEDGFTRAMLQRGVLNNGDTLSYAFGLAIDAWRGLRTIAHGGSLAGFRSFVIRFPDQATAVSVFCNVTNADPGGRARDVAEIVLGHLMEPEEAEGGEAATEEEPDAPAPELSPHQFDAYAGTYYSEELDARVVIEPGDDGLVFVTPDGRRRAIAPAAADTFAGRGDVYRFQRDDDGSVTGFVLDAGRANGLVFRRVEDDG